MVVRRIQNDELYHHGVKGQRWGHRKQRELIGRRRGSRPIQSSTTSFASKRQRSGVQRFSDFASRKSTQRAFKATAIASASVATGLAAYNLYKKKKINPLMIDKGREVFVASYRTMKALPKY